MTGNHIAVGAVEAAVVAGIEAVVEVEADPRIPAQTVRANLTVNTVADSKTITTRRDYRSSNRKRRKHKRSRSHSRSRSKKSKHKRHRRRSSSSSEDSDDNPRSAITGKKLKLKVVKSSEDKKREKNRTNLLDFLNASYD
ncbi:hypothetical protein BG011_002466 [Mortierella polycephala]|uniref:Uncharacterized protein n=1 Tax=Mortierella polycephala TaxID=41804 RepID=A0A9P6U9F1_9FUNG|nr:hypothetical protein BG011_002466 [Mortierella polycephala]